MKKLLLLLLLIITCLSCTNHRFKHKVGDIVYVNTTIFSMHDDSLLVATIKDLSHGSDSLKAKVLKRVWVEVYQHPYYEVEFYDTDGTVIKIEGEKGFIYEHITAIPEQRLN